MTYLRALGAENRPRFGMGNHGKQLTNIGLEDTGVTLLCIMSRIFLSILTSFPDPRSLIMKEHVEKHV